MTKVVAVVAQGLLLVLAFVGVFYAITLVIATLAPNCP